MTVIHGFELIQERDIPELASKARLFRHVRTGARLLSLENDDDNKCFGVGFKTPPADSSGLPHILEHSVLNGSRKYPVKEPFVELLKASLNTFLNAMTFPDMTIYPVASTNVQDFYNLVDVYLDAVFYPRISPMILQQEGWHYETESSDAALTYKGVVFNEMKGYHSTPDYALETSVQAALLPDTPYVHDSGGNPANIPDLTYTQFKSFHDTYYHPANAFIFFYGDDDPNERLRLIDAFIAEFTAKSVDATVPLQPRFDAPRTVVKRYDAGESGDESNKGLATISWLLPEVTDAETILELEVLEHILIKTAASPLRKALIDSGIGENLAGEGLDALKRQASFTVGLRGIKPTDGDKVETLVLSTLSKLAEEGIDPQMVEASLNTIEFQLREKNTGGFPRGLAAFIGVLQPWMHGGDPLEHLAFDEPLQRIKARYAEQAGYFETMIGEYFLDNPHRVTVILQPDPQVKVERDTAEETRLQRERSSMSPDAIETIIADMEELERRQTMPDAPEDLAKIPRLTLADLEREIKTVPTEIISGDNGTIYYHDLATSGIVYADIGFDLYALPDDLLPYVGLFGRALVEIGTEREDYVRLLQRIGAKTGGIRPDYLASQTIGQAGSIAYLFLRAKAMGAQTQDMLDILSDILLTVKLDNRERFLQMALEDKARQEAGLGMSGHLIANNRLRAHFDDAGWFSEQLSGISHLFFVRELIGQIQNDWEAVLEKLETLRSLLINRSAAVVNVTADADTWATFQPQLDAFLSGLPSSPFTPQTWQRAALPPYEGVTVPTQVNFVGKGANLYDLGYKVHGSHVVILKHLNLDYMWNKVRVQGGAYGGTCLFNHVSGVTTFLSWQDPNLIDTLKIYDGTADYLRKIELSESDLEKAIIGAISQLDPYQLPDAKGYSATMRHLIGYTDAMRQQMRDEVLGTTIADFRALADVMARIPDAGYVVVTSSAERIAKANEAMGGKLAVTPVM